MWAKTITLVFCGYTWSIATNQGLYDCTTKFSENECKVAVVCRTGEGSYDPQTKKVTAITQSKELQCGKEEVEFTRLIIYNEFAASISCQRDQ